MIGVRTMQRLTRVLLAATLLVVVCAVALWVAQRPAFEIRRIELRSASGALQHVSAAAVRTALRGDGRGALRGGYFTLRLEDARRVFESVPWVAGVSVRRAWPNRLIVTFTEHRAVGTWGDDRLVSDTGVVFVANAAEAEVDGTLPQFDGPDRFAPEAVQRFRELSSLLAPLQMAVEVLDVSERASWTLRTDTEQTFELGRDEPAGRIAQRLSAALAVYPLVVARAKGAPPRIDLRYANGFAVALPASHRTP
ncbi:MAG: cell division protein FtsQ/DivIB [Gemmatimonadota bacterium]